MLILKGALRPFYLRKSLTQQNNFVKRRCLATKALNLPSLPVPPLDASLKKYLTAVKPLLSQSEFDSSQQIASEFGKGVGAQLQSLLEEKASHSRNWFAKWWLNKGYLEPRYSVVSSVNPATLYPKAGYITQSGKLFFAAQYVTGLLAFKKHLEDGKLSVEQMGGAPLCMNQYYTLLGTCRIPVKDGVDQLDVTTVNGEDEKYQRKTHMTVMYNDRIFRVDLLNAHTGAWLSQQDIYNSLTSLVQKASESSESGDGLGILTTENRDVWADTYQEMITNSDINRASFADIHDSLFVLCLDEEKEKSTSPTDLMSERSTAAGQLLHGNKRFTSNRFFDKCIQVVIGDNGVWGVNMEHTVAEAGPHNVMNDFIWSHIKASGSSGNEKKRASNLGQFDELKFELSDSVRSQIFRSTQTIHSSIDNLDLCVLDFDRFGKSFPKSQRCSPDAFVQVAMQLAFYRLHAPRLGNAYESGSVRKFSQGRTDVIRACSQETAEFVGRANQATSKTSKRDCGQLLLRAIQSHGSFTKEVVQGQSFDRHLFGLKLLAAEHKLNAEFFFNDVAYQRACYYLISSSQVSSKHRAVTVYAPAVDDGYGMCYNILEDRFMFGLSANNSCSTTSAKQMANAVTGSLHDCKEYLLNVK